MLLVSTTRRAATCSRPGTSASLRRTYFAVPSAGSRDRSRNPRRRRDPRRHQAHRQSSRATLVPFDVCPAYLARRELRALRTTSGEIPAMFEADRQASAFVAHRSRRGLCRWNRVFSRVPVFGMKRAIFSNEAGQGSSPIAHSAAKTDEPVREGIVAGLEPFIDTIVVCTFTALIILVHRYLEPRTRPADVELDTLPDVRSRPKPGGQFAPTRVVPGDDWHDGEHR